MVVVVLGLGVVVVVVVVGIVSAFNGGFVELDFLEVGLGVVGFVVGFLEGVLAVGFGVPGLKVAGSGVVDFKVLTFGAVVLVRLVVLTLGLSVVCGFGVVLTVVVLNGLFVVVVVVVLLKLILLEAILWVTGWPYLLVTSSMGGVTVKLASFEFIRVWVGFPDCGSGRNMGGACSVVVVVVLLEVPLRGSSRIPDNPSMNALNKLGSSFKG